MIDQNGIHDLAESEYHADPVIEPSLSSSLAKILINRTPAHAWTASPRLNPHFRPIEKDAFDLGRAFHRQMLGRGAPVEVIEAENWSSKAAREQRDLARIAGRTPMLAHQAADLAVMVAAAREHLAEFGIVLDQVHRNELAVFARAEVEGCWCRALIDHAPENPLEPLLDLKTTTDASPEACIKSVASYGYDLQAAHYLDTWAAATNERRRFRFAFIETSPPFAMSLVELHDQEGDEADWMQSARYRAALARRTWARCLATDTWPGYPRQVAVLGVPRWHAMKTESLLEERVDE